MTVHYQNPYLPHTLRGVPVPRSAKKAVPLTLDSTGLPIGTAAQVIVWVDDDPERAERFLVKEQRETRPRVSLVANLKAVLKRHQIVIEEAQPTQLAPQIDVIPAERAAIEGEADGQVDQLALVRERLKVEGS